MGNDSKLYDGAKFSKPDVDPVHFAESRVAFRRYSK